MKGSKTTTNLLAIILMVLGMALVALIAILFITRNPPPDLAGQATLITADYEGQAKREPRWALQTRAGHNLHWYEHGGAVRRA